MLDIFNNDAFSLASLTDAINQTEYVPGRIGELKLFRPTSVTTLSILIESKGGALSLVAPSPRGGPGETRNKRDRKMRSFLVPHFEINDAVMADEVQGIRAFGSETEIEQVSDKVAERNAEHVDDMAVTEEHSRLGAIKGLITYKDGSTLDLFSEFGETQEAETAFDFANNVDGALREVCAGVTRTMATNAKGMPFQRVHALCGNDFFDALLKNAEIRATYDGWSAAKILREGYISPQGKIYGAFEFGDIVWENYRGNDGVGGTFVAADKCHMFPAGGAPGLFRSYYAPADYVETVNTKGKRLYVKQWQMPNDKGVNLDVQMNALQLCTRPKTLMQGKLGA